MSPRTRPTDLRSLTPLRLTKRLSILACLAVACTGGSAAPEEIDPCETEGPAPATSGGDHGPPWQGIPDPPADDTAGERLDVWLDDYNLPDDFMPPGVIEWEEDPLSEIQYRRPTELELESNRWSGNLLLVALEDSFVTSASTAAAKVTLSLPLADAEPWSPQEDLPVISVPLVHQSTRDFAGTVEHYVKATGFQVITASRPVFHSYIQEDLDWGTVDDVAIHMFAQNNGGIVVSGATYGRTFWLEGPQKDNGDLITIEIEPEPGRKAYLLHTQHGPPLSQLQLDDDQVALHVENRKLPRPEQSLVAELDTTHGGILPAINQCTDGLNNDPNLNDVADGCDFSCMPHPDFGTDLYPDVEPIWEYARPFAVVGSAEWCSNHPDDWKDLLQAFGRTAEEMLNWVEAPATFPGPRVPPFRLAGLYCWVFADLETALECHDAGLCPPGYEDYPFDGVGNTWTSDVSATTYLARVWSGTDAWATDAIGKGRPDIIHPLQNVAVVVTRTDPSLESVGLAYSHTAPNWLVGGAVILGAHTTVNGFGMTVSVEDIDPIVIGRGIAHEIGHTHGLNHDPTYFDGYAGFMNDTGGPVPKLGESVDSTIESFPATVPPTLLTQYEAWTLVAPSKWFPRPPGFSHVGCSETPDNCPPGLTCIDTVEGGFECLP